VGVILPIFAILLSSTPGEQMRIRQRWKYAWFGFFALLACIVSGVLIGQLLRWVSS
jgi:hypothetical protein